jgi:hypothetical protein
MFLKNRVFGLGIRSAGLSPLNMNEYIEKNPQKGK